MSGSADDISEPGKPPAFPRICGTATGSPSLYSGSNSSDSEPCRKRFTRTRQPKKRKAAAPEVAISRSRIKRLKSHYNDEYRRLFNDTIRSLDPRTVSNEQGSMGTSQVGITVWSADEKSRLFHALDRKGRHDIRRIATAVATKNESEVHVYLKLLQSSARDQELHVTHRKDLFDIATIDAAVEISPTCETALQSSADAVSMLQFREEQRIEKAKNPRFWLLMPSTAKWVDQCLLTDEGQQEIADVLPAAALLNLGTMLKVSKGFFMNSSEPENNWRTYAEKRKAPSIMYTAFSDLHTLALSLTKRLIQSSLFFAMSRIRAETMKRMPPKRSVRRKDVLATLNVLGIEANTDKTWINVAQKFNLRVYENVRYKRAWGKRYSYNEVEQILSTSDIKRGRYRLRSRETRAEVLSSEDLQSARSPEEDSDSQEKDLDPSTSDLSIASRNLSLSSSAVDDSDLAGLEFADQDGPARRQEQQELLLDAYLESLDLGARQKEEKRLWEMLGIDSATQLNAPERNLPKKSVPPGKSKEALDDWTDWVDYAAEWETLEMPVPAKSFVENQRVRKKRRPAVTRGVEDDEDDDDNGGGGGILSDEAGENGCADIHHRPEDRGGHSVRLSEEGYDSAIGATDTSRDNSDPAHEDSEEDNDD
ncbi:MAG: hypothetical protein Q9217_001297 [Psora testacea]